MSIEPQLSPSARAALRRIAETEVQRRNRNGRGGQAALVRETKLPVSQISRLLSGKGRLGFTNAQRFAERLGYSFADILHGRIVRIGETAAKSAETNDAVGALHAAIRYHGDATWPAPVVRAVEQMAAAGTLSATSPKQIAAILDELSACCSSCSAGK